MGEDNVDNNQGNQQTQASTDQQLGDVRVADEPQIQTQAPIESPASPPPPDAPEMNDAGKEPKKGRSVKPFVVVVLLLIIAGAVGAYVIFFSGSKISLPQPGKSPPPITATSTLYCFID